MTRRWSAREVLELVLDHASFDSWDRPISLAGCNTEYRAELDAAAARAGTDEAVVTGRGTIQGRPVAVLVGEFGFLGGSIGRAAATRITAALRRATAERLPVLASTASGGTRMQEGTPAFWEMVQITRAVMDHRAAGLPYLVHLRHPTTGGVYASWGSLGQITVAEPRALVGFLGPKVYEGLHRSTFPAAVQTAENLAAKGVIDAVVATPDLRSYAERVLRVLVDPPTAPPLARSRGNDAKTIRHQRPDEKVVWDSVRATRAAGRVGVRELLSHGASSTVRLRGTSEGERDDSVVVALTRLDGEPCVLIGQDRHSQERDRPMGPGALRAARRGMHLAQENSLPLVTIVDTPGAELSPQAEEGAIAGEIARCIATLGTITVPSVSVLLGQGTGGGALAFLPAQRIVAMQNAWLAPLPPEGASLIVHGDTSHAASMAYEQHIHATELFSRGIVHQVVPETADDNAFVARAVAAACAHHIRAQTQDGLRDC